MIRLKFAKQKKTKTKECYGILWQAKCSHIQFVYFYMYFSITYSTMRLIFNLSARFNALFNIELLA